MQSFCYVVLLQWLPWCRTAGSPFIAADAKPITWKCSFIDPGSVPLCSVQRGVYVTVCKYCLNLVPNYCCCCCCCTWLAFIAGQIELGVELSSSQMQMQMRIGMGLEWVGSTGILGVWEINNLYANFAMPLPCERSPWIWKYSASLCQLATLHHTTIHPYLLHKQTVRKLKAKYDDVRLADSDSG